MASFDTVDARSRDKHRSRRDRTGSPVHRDASIQSDRELMRAVRMRSVVASEAPKQSCVRADENASSPRLRGAVTGLAMTL